MKVNSFFKKILAKTYKNFASIFVEIIYHFFKSFSVAFQFTARFDAIRIFSENLRFSGRTIYRNLKASQYGTCNVNTTCSCLRQSSCYAGSVSYCK